MNQEPQNQPSNEITVEDLAKRMLVENMRNIAKKLKNGETLTPAELNVLRTAADGKATDGFAKNYVELANALGVSRRTIHTWTKTHSDCPKARADGRHDIASWREWAANAGLDDAIEESPGKLKARNMLLQNEKLTFQIGVLKREYIPRGQVEAAGASLATVIRKVVTALHLSAPDFAGRTTQECAALLVEKEDEILEQLHTIPQQIREMTEGAVESEVQEGVAAVEPPEPATE